MKLRTGGYFGSTQGTIMALKAISAYALHTKQQRNEGGEFILNINGKEVARKTLKLDQLANLRIAELAEYLKEGENHFSIEFQDMQSGLPYTFDMEWVTLTPPSAKTSMLKVNTALAQPETKVGETLHLSVELENMFSTKDAPSAMALIGIPAGLSLQSWQLKELLEKKIFDFYEIKDNYLILYYRQIEKNSHKTILLDLKAEVPRTYRAPASNSYMYYMDAEKEWIPGEFITVEP